MKALVFLARLHVANLPQPGTVTTDSMTGAGYDPFLPSPPSPSLGSVQLLVPRVLRRRRGRIPLATSIEIEYN